MAKKKKEEASEENIELTADEKRKRLSHIINAVNNSSNQVVCGFLDDEKIKERLNLKFIQTPNDDLNEAIGGGFPLGRCCVITGKEDSGKTSLLLETIGLAMKRDPDFFALWLESEQSLNFDYAIKTFGIDPERFVFVQVSLNEGAEKALDNCEAILRAGGINMFCINSVKALVPRTELNKSITEDTVAMQARMNTKMLKKYLTICYEHDTSIVLVQHLTTMIGGAMTRDPYLLGGGLFMKYGGLLILDMRKQSLQDTDPITREEGMKICISVKKNHITPRKFPYVKVNHYVIYGQGTEVLLSTLNKAVEQNIIVKGGAWYTWTDKDLKWCGKNEYRKYMIEHPDDLQTLRNIVSGVIENLSEKEIIELNIGSSDSEQPEDKSDLE